MAKPPPRAAVFVRVLQHHLSDSDGLFCGGSKRAVDSMAFPPLFIFLSEKLHDVHDGMFDPLSYWKTSKV